jgi:hypothetical protein
MDGPVENLLGSKINSPWADTHLHNWVVIFARAEFDCWTRGEKFYAKLIHWMVELNDKKWRVRIA